MWFSFSIFSQLLSSKFSLPLSCYSAIPHFLNDSLKVGNLRRPDVVSLSGKIQNLFWWLWKLEGTCYLFPFLLWMWCLVFWLHRGYASGDYLKHGLRKVGLYGNLIEIEWYGHGQCGLEGWTQGRSMSWCCMGTSLGDGWLRSLGNQKLQFRLWLGWGTWVSSMMEAGEKWNKRINQFKKAKK